MKKTIIISIIIGLILASAFYYLRLPQIVEFSDEPQDWLDGNNVDVFYATEGKSFPGLDNLQYNGEGISTAFSLEGFYQGKKFLGEYKINNKTIMKITSELDPKDGVINGFIFENIKGDKIKAYLFVDEDWKNYVGNTNILWGANYENEQEFIYKEIKKGIYMNEINDDKLRFNKDYSLHRGGIIIGDISKLDAKDKTIIVLK